MMKWYGLSMLVILLDQLSKQFAEVVDELLQGGDHAATS